MATDGTQLRLQKKTVGSGLSLKNGQQADSKAALHKGESTSKTTASVKKAASRTSASPPLSFGIMYSFKTRSATKTTPAVSARLYRRRSRATLEDLPEEMLLKIFAHLDVQSLMSVSCVNKKLSAVASDNLLWQDIFQQYVHDKFLNRQSTASLESSQKLPASYWKKICLTRWHERQNKFALDKLKKTDPFTGLPKQTESVIRRSGVVYKLCLLDRRNAEHVYEVCDAHWHKMAANICWYSPGFLPMREVCCIRLIACCPLLFGADGKSVAGSPWKRCLMCEENIKPSQWTKERPALASDGVISLHWLPGNFLLAIWKADGEIAFIATGLHYKKLVQRSLLGTTSGCYKEKEHKIIVDDIDPTYGLHGYQTTLELRNMRQSLWAQQFYSLHCSGADAGIGNARFTLIRHDCTTDHTPLEKNINFPWRTELFQGIVEMTVWLDLTVLDERGEVFDAFSSAVQVQKSSLQGSDFEYEDNNHLVIRYDSGRTAVHMELGQLQDERLFVRHLELSLALPAVNAWFGTKY